MHSFASTSDKSRVEVDNRANIGGDDEVCDDCDENSRSWDDLRAVHGPGTCSNRSDPCVGAKVFGCVSGVVSRG